MAPEHSEDWMDGYTAGLRGDPLGVYRSERYVAGWETGTIDRGRLRQAGYRSDTIAPTETAVEYANRDV